MRTDSYTQFLLTAIAVSLAAIAIRPLASPAPAAAQTVAPEYFIEPGVFMLRSPDGMRSQLGKVVVDLQSGNVWGFPTGTDAPYPVEVGGTKPPISRPYLLGRYDLNAMQK